MTQAATYHVEGAQGFEMPAPDARTALAHALAAEKKFPPIRIRGPQGPISLDELRKLADAEREA